MGCCHLLTLQFPQSGPSADDASADMDAALSAAGLTAPVSGTANIAKALKAWNAEGAVAGESQGAAAPPAPMSPASAATGDARAVAAAKLAAEEEERRVVVEAEMHRYSALDAEFRSQDWFKAKVKRTGWSKPIPGYTPATCPCGESIPGCTEKSQICCGNSWEDMGWILLCFLVLYASVALYFYALLEFNQATDEGHFALYLFVGLLAIFWVGLLTFARSGPAHNPAPQGDEEEAGAAATDGATAAEETAQPLAA